MLPTPDLSHLKPEDFDAVYEPAGVTSKNIFKKSFVYVNVTEDTFLLLDALELEAETLKALKPLICLEIGYVCQRLILFPLHVHLTSSGSGCVSSFIASILGSSVCAFAPSTS